MSYEGRVQTWCKKGHYAVESASYDPPGEVCGCGDPIVYTNEIDDTNCDAWGYIVPVEVKPAVECTCASCGTTHVSMSATYEIPNKQTVHYRRYDDGTSEPRWVPLEAN